MPSQKKKPKASRPDMPGYGIVDAKSGEGLLPWSWAGKQLAKARTYFLSTVRPDGRPHVMPLWGVWLDDKFYFSTGKHSVKARNLEANSSCVLCPEGGEEAVILEGDVEKLKNRTTFKKFAKAYLAKYGFDVSGMDEPVYVLRPRVVFGQIEKTYPKSATRWVFWK